MQWLRRTSSWIASAMLGDALVGWLLPVLVAAIGTVIAQLGDTPLFHVYVGAFIVAAMTSTLWLNFDRWRNVTRMEGKLAFNGVRLLRIIDEQGALKGLRLGVMFGNQANRPMTFIVDSMETKVIYKSGQRTLYPLAMPYTKNEFVVRPGDHVIFDAHNIEIPGSTTGDYLAEIRCTITYGNASNAKYSLSLARRGDFSIHNDVIPGTIVWYDA